MSGTRELAGGAGPGDRNERGILDSKAWVNVKMLNEDKTGFREWYQKFRNAYCQARPGRRTRIMWDAVEKKAMEYMKKECLPAKEEAFTSKDVEEFDVKEGDYVDEFGLDIMVMLLDRTEGSLTPRVMASYRMAQRMIPRTEDTGHLLKCGHGS